MNDFYEKLIPKLQKELGEDFSRLITEYGEALDGKAYITLHPEALKQGLSCMSALSASFGSMRPG